MISLSYRLAWAELRITMAKLLWHFDFELASPDEDWSNKQRTYLIWERLPLMVKLKARITKRPYIRTHANEDTSIFGNGARRGREVGQLCPRD